SHPEATYLQALIHFRAGRYQQAQNFIQTSLKFAPDNESAQLLSASISYALGAFFQAEGVLKPFTKSHPDNLFARRLLASTLLELNQGTRALEVIEPALARGLQDAALFAIAGSVHMKAGDYSKASNLF